MITRDVMGFCAVTQTVSIYIDGTSIERTSSPKATGTSESIH